MKKLLFSLNTGLRFGLEMASLALLVYLGLGRLTFPSQILIGLLLPLGFAAIWGRWIAPKSTHRLKAGRRVCLEIALFTGVGLLIASTTSPSLASVYFLLALSNSLINQWKEKNHEI